MKADNTLKCKYPSNYLILFHSYSIRTTKCTFSILKIQCPVSPAPRNHFLRLAAGPASPASLLELGCMLLIS